MDRNNPFSVLKAKEKKEPPSAEPAPVEKKPVEQLPPQEILKQPAPVLRRAGRPKENRPKRIVAFTSVELYSWIEQLEHAPRADGSYFSSQAAVINRLLEIARETLNQGREKL